MVRRAAIRSNIKHTQHTHFFIQPNPSSFLFHVFSYRRDAHCGVPSHAIPTEHRKKPYPTPLGCGFFVRYCSLVSSSCASASSSSSRRLSRATRTASTTKAEKVQSLPRMVSSTSDITSTGKRMLLGSVAGILGILNFHIGFTSIIGLCGNVHFSNFFGEMSLE